MSFRRKTTETDQWRKFCHRHKTLIEQLPRLSPLFSSSSRFDEFLETGIYQSNLHQISMHCLTNEEWDVFLLFVEEYSKDWETYFVPTLYHAYFAENKRRC